MRLTKAPIEDIGLLMIENPACTLTGTLLSSLASAGVAVSICDTYHLPNAVMLPLDGVSIHAMRTRALAELAKPKKKRAWQQIVACKIYFQAQVIQHLERESALLKRLAQEVDPGDSKNREATAARIYWRVVYSDLEKGFRRSGENKINPFLNYGYAVVRSAIARSLVGAGLTPIFGLFHKSRDNAFALADDLLEVYRPFVDQYIRGLLISKVDLSEHPFKKELLRILTTRLIVRGEVSPFLSAIDSTVESLVKIVTVGAKSRLVFPDLCEFRDTV